MLTNTNNNYYKELTTTTDSNCQERQFNELMEYYPSQGTKPDGTTYPLKGKKNDCRRAYIDYLSANERSHDEIMTALKVEMSDKQSSWSTNFQPGLLRWIEDKIFEQYRGRTTEPVELGYGTDII